MGQRQKYENKNSFYRYAVNRFLSRIKKAVDFTGAKKILDIGCAEGFVIKYLKDLNPELMFLGADVDKEALNEAKRLNPSTAFLEKSIYDVGGLKQNFDLVMTIEVLEHLNRYDEALKTLSSLDAKYFLLSVPNEPFFRAINFLRGRYWHLWGNIPEHVNTWSKRKFKKIISRHFNVIADFSSFPWTVFLAVKKIK